MRVDMDIHKFVKAYQVDIPGYIYSGISVNRGGNVSENEVSLLCMKMQI